MKPDDEHSLECRAYAESSACGQAKHRKRGCPEASYGECCKTLVWYISSSSREKEKACNNAAE